MTKITEWYKTHPKTVNTFWLLAAYAAGSQGGAPAANAVTTYGPSVLGAIAKVLGG